MKKVSKVREIVAANVPDYLEKIFQLDKAEGVRCFRGEANENWEMKPSVMRRLKADAEQNIIRELTLEAVDEFDRDTSMFRRLVRAQHYGLPTRLLDVSLNPLAALFFACDDDASKDNDARIVILDFPRSRIKFADSDAVSVLCNLANLKDDEKAQLAESIIEYKDADETDEAMVAFNEKPEVDRLIHFIRSERPHFRPQINPSDLLRYYFVHPPKNNKRIIAQSGAFVVAGMLEYKKITGLKSFKTTTVKISKRDKEKILIDLDSININRRTMFPEIEFASKYIKKKWEEGEMNDSPTEIDDDLLV